MRLEVKNLSKSYPQRKGWFAPKQPVLQNVSFQLEQGQSLAIVGESGSGKSTLARLIVGLEQPDSGQILCSQTNNKRPMSIVFQDYSLSINPAMNVLQAVSEPLPSSFSATQKQDCVAQALQQVGLNPDLMWRYPQQLSGGQQQRVCLSRALIHQAELIVLDEAVSALDVPNQLQILDLLLELKQRHNLSYLFITHDLQALCYLCQELIFLQQGHIVEQTSVQNLRFMQSDYAQKLLCAAS